MKNSKKIVEELMQIGFSFNNSVGSIAKYLLTDHRFPLWSGSPDSNKHHYGQGGLIQHTYEVVVLCLKNCDIVTSFNNEELDKEVLFLAALYHDAGKMWDYQPNGDGTFNNWQSTNHKRNIHHISRSALYFNEVANKIELNKNKTDKVLHCILSHHGHREWGSPVAPNTKEAYLLHFCDMISARMDDCNKIDLVNINPL